MALIRKRTGNFLEDFRLGQVFRHKGGRTLSSGLIAHFTDFSFTANPLHKNAELARLYGYADIPVPPGLVMAVAFSQTVEDVSENARANLEYVDVRFGAIVYPGDTLETGSCVLGVRGSKSRADLGVVHVQSVARNQKGRVVLAYERKVQVFRQDEKARLDEGEVSAPPVEVELELPPYRADAGYARKAYLSSADTYFEDFNAGDTLEHARGRTLTDEHIALTGMLDNTAQVHCNRTLIERDPARYLGGQLVVYGGIPFALALGLSSRDVADNSLGDLGYRTGRHTSPVFAGDTVFASTEIAARRDCPGRPDLGILEVILRGHKFENPGPAEKRVEVFYLERELVVKRRAAYT
jgi:2-methylfumaryl-CoA hydratase